MKKGQTNYQFKLLYALGMIFIVAGHCYNGGISLFYNWLPPYAFHIGLFVFASGYFYKDKYDKEPAIRYIWKKVKHLLIPLFLWNLFYALFVWLLSYKDFTIGTPVTIEKIFLAPITSGQQFSWNIGGWFIIPLFMAQIWNVIFRKTALYKFKSSTKSIYAAVIYLALGLFGVFLAQKGFNTGWWLVLTRFLFFLPFYGAGILYKSHLEKHDHAKNVPYFGMIFLSLLIILLILNKIPTFDSSNMRNFNYSFFMPFLTSFLGIAFWLRISRILTPVLGKSKIVNLIADNSYSIMINQYLGFMIINLSFAALSKIITISPDFNWGKFKSTIQYAYLPNNDQHFAIIYLAAGILVPIIMQKIVNIIAQRCRKTKPTSLS